MNKPAFLVLTTLLLCIATGTACLGADSASLAPEKTQPAGSKSGAPPGEDRPDNPFERKGRIDALARGVWHNWLKVRADWQFHSAFYAYAWAFTYWLNKNEPEAYRRYASAVLNTKDGGDAEGFLDAFAIRPARPLPDIKSILGPDNRDVAANQREAVACLDERIAILSQTPEIQDMHRRWAEWMRTTFEKLPDPQGTTSSTNHNQPKTRT